MFSKLVFAGFTRCALGALALLASSSGVSLAQEAELNLYSARHYANAPKARRGKPAKTSLETMMSFLSMKPHLRPNTNYSHLR